MTIWQPQPLAISLGHSEVHVWHVSLLKTSTVVDCLCEFLSADEYQRAQSFRFDRDQRRFIVAHGVLRLVLSQYLNCQPAELAFTEGEFGKPALITNSSLRFNLSHSEDVALFAVAYNQEVGIDVEYMRPIEDIDKLAQHFLSPQERSLMCHLQSEQLVRAFYSCWTRKEAYLKALGTGFVGRPNSFKDTLTPEVLDSPKYEDEVSLWTLYELIVEESWSATLAVEGIARSVQCWRWIGA